MLNLTANRRTQLALHLGAWLLMAAFFWVVLATQMPFGEVAALVVGNFGLLAALFYAHTSLVNRFWERGQFGLFFMLGSATTALVCTARYFINVLVLEKYLLREGLVIFSAEQRLAIFGLATSFIFAVVAVVFQLLANRYRRENQNLALLAEQRAAELQFLKAQINPHFLFNALHNIYSLTVVKSDLAPAMLLKLSSLLRYVIYDSRLAEVPLEREVAEIRQFIDLFSMRCERQPDLIFDVIGDPAGHQMEPMLLIPIVENCFKHADFDTSDRAFCRLRLDISEKNCLVFEARNSFNPADKQKDNQGGVGLENMKRRLELRYADRHEFHFGEKNDVFEVVLKIKN